ncbi:LOW QUALITY PROTEIN: hypothetical protein HID58_067205 [Brassica napus]|uniref:Uncharacterized protein n=1 Tax=Brassica napus TaxID=3708 RepID=A0ABQ7ZHW9_BRANA|nr:LOW QUALITY PROTEIN: hypothetical protein HID58_067205 [Brassica napus]
MFRKMVEMRLSLKFHCHNTKKFRIKVAHYNFTSTRLFLTATKIVSPAVLPPKNPPLNTPPTLLAAQNHRPGAEVEISDVAESSGGGTLATDDQKKAKRTKLARSDAPKSLHQWLVQTAQSACFSNNSLLISLKSARLSLNTMVKPTSKDPPLLGESSSLNTTKRKRGRPLGVRNKDLAHLRPHKIGNSAELKEKQQKLEGRVPISTSDKMYQRFDEGKIYHIRYFNLLPNNRRYSLTVQPYIINTNETTIITLIQENIPPIPSNIFRPQRYPNVVGRICLIQRTDLYNHNTDTKIIIGLRLDKSKMDNQEAYFRELIRISTRKHQIVIITSIIPRLHEEKLSLTTTPRSRFYFDNDIDIIQRFQKKNKLLS